ncbi:unnamed protein product, partial [marine sediment metagenome]
DLSYDKEFGIYLKAGKTTYQSIKDTIDDASGKRRKKEFKNDVPTWKGYS